MCVRVVQHGRHGQAVQHVMCGRAVQHVMRGQAVQHAMCAPGGRSALRGMACTRPPPSLAAWQTRVPPPHHLRRKLVRKD